MDSYKHKLLHHTDEDKLKNKPKHPKSSLDHVLIVSEVMNNDQPTVNFQRNIYSLPRPPEKKESFSRNGKDANILIKNIKKPERLKLKTWKLRERRKIESHQMRMNRNRKTKISNLKLERWKNKRKIRSVLISLKNIRKNKIIMMDYWSKQKRRKKKNEQLSLSNIRSSEILKLDFRKNKRRRKKKTIKRGAKMIKKKQSNYQFRLFYQMLFKNEAKAEFKYKLSSSPRRVAWQRRKVKLGKLTHLNSNES